MTDMGAEKAAHLEAQRQVLMEILNGDTHTLCGLEVEIKKLSQRLKQVQAKSSAGINRFVDSLLASRVMLERALEQLPALAIWRLSHPRGDGGDLNASLAEGILCKMLAVEFESWVHSRGLSLRMYSETINLVGVFLKDTRRAREGGRTRDQTELGIKIRLLEQLVDESLRSVVGFLACWGNRAFNTIAHTQHPQIVPHLKSIPWLSQLLSYDRRWWETLQHHSIQVYLICLRPADCETSASSDEQRRLATQRRFLEDLEYFVEPQYLSFINVLRCFGSESVPELLFVNSRAKRKRWCGNGTIIEVEPTALGLSPQLHALLRDDWSPEQMIKGCRGAVVLDLQSEKKTFRLDDDAKDLVNDEVDNRSCGFNDALKLILWSYPRVDDGDDSFLSEVSLLGPLLREVASKISSEGWDIITLQSLAECLLVSATTGSFERRRNLLDRAETFIGDDEILLARLAYGRSVLFRLTGDYESSSSVLDSYHRNYNGVRTPNPSPLLHGIQGLLNTSRLENLVQQNKFDAAQSAIDDWSVSDLGSDAELQIIPPRTLVVARILRSRSRFGDACDALYDCLKIGGIRVSAKIRIVCMLADTHCDLKEFNQARNVAVHFLSSSERSSISGKGKRRLGCCEIDILIGLGHLRDASCLATTMLDDFKKLTEPDMTDQMLHVRVYVAHARVAHLNSDHSSSLTWWRAALRLATLYKTFYPPGATVGVIRISAAREHLLLNGGEEARLEYDEAKALLQDNNNDMWLPMMRAWHESVREEVDGQLN